MRSGFHRTTMQDVAAEAGMSPGNLYRYFRSKDAIVMALTERDRARIGEDFSAFSQSDDFVGIFRQLARRHFAEEPRERSILCLEIWAEATRNRSFAAISEAFEEDIHGRMAALFRDAQDKGLIDANVDPSSLRASGLHPGGRSVRAARHLAAIRRRSARSGTWLRSWKRRSPEGSDLIRPTKRPN